MLVEETAAIASDTAFDLAVQAPGCSSVVGPPRAEETAPFFSRSVEFQRPAGAEAVRPRASVFRPWTDGRVCQLAGRVFQGSRHVCGLKGVLGRRDELFID